MGRAISDSGQVAGSASTTDGSSRAFLWDGTTMQDLGTLGGTDSLATDINASGQVTGRAETTDGATHAFLWDGTTMRDLGTLEGFNSFGAAINASGQVAGYTLTADAHNFHAFLWDGTTLHDLNALIDSTDPLQPFVTLIGGVDINDVGQILANGVDIRSGESHAYLVSPIPRTVSEPGALVLLGVGLAGLGFTRPRSAA